MNWPWRYSVGLRFVPVDFETQTLARQLQQAGFDAQAPAFFSWLGVSMYLTVPAILQMLGTVAAAPHGSAIVFDYLVPPGCLDLAQRLPMQAVAAMVALAGEPWRTYYEPQTLAGELQALGFQQLQDLDATHINVRFFNARSSGLHAGPMARVMHAQV